MQNFIICQIWQNWQKSLENLPTDKARNIVPSIYLENKPKEASAKNTYRILRHCVTLMVIKFETRAYSPFYFIEAQE